MTEQKKDLINKNQKFNTEIARIAVGGYEDVQEMRKSAFNRIRDIIRKVNEDIPFDQVEEEKENKKYDKKYNDSNLEQLVEKMFEKDKLTKKQKHYIDDMLEAGAIIENLENQYSDLMSISKKEPIYTQWIQHIYGVSHTLTAKLINIFGYCENFERVSNLWSYCGFTPNQKRKKGEKLGYNPDAKKLGWIIADCIMKQGSKSLYRTKFFDPYKNEQIKKMGMVKDRETEVKQVVEINRNGDTGPDQILKENFDGNIEKYKEDDEIAINIVPATIDKEKETILFKGTAPKSQGHAHNRAIRYLAKKFLKHYWAIARSLKGLDIPDEYIITHGGHEKKEDTFENPFYAKQALIDRK